MPSNISGIVTAQAVIIGSSYQLGKPAKILVLTPEQEQATPYSLIGDPLVQVATQPAGLDAIQLLWEVNDFIPYDARRYRAVTSIFTPHGQEEFLKDKTFKILTSSDGKTFSQIAEVQGPTNSFLHQDVEPHRLYYYKVQALDADGKLLAESPVTMAAAGENLFSEESFENIVSSPANDRNAICVVPGARAYSQGQRLVRLQTSATVNQASFYGNQIALSADKTYLQGGWVRAPGNVWYGRFFYDQDKKGISWGYSMMAVRNTPEWTFAVQLLSPDTDGSGFPRKAGRVSGMAQKQWMFPTEAVYMGVFVTAFGPGEAGNFWIVEINP